MAKTFFGRAVKAFSVMVATVVLVGCAFMFTACESKNPKIAMTISFNEQEYTVEYKLYRNLYPQTVAHYLELIDLGYYNDTVIHDYQSSRMIGGGFTYDDMENSDVMEDLTQIDYDAFTANEDGSLKLKNISVWTDVSRGNEFATNRLYGETSDNGFSVTNGALTNKRGAIGTYSYVYDVNKDASQTVYTRQSSGGEGQSAYYKNSFQGMFYIYTGSSTAKDSKYCVFGELANEDSETTFTELTDAISDYVSEHEDLERFTEMLNNSVIKDSMVDGKQFTTTTPFEVPQCKIIIKSVKVLKY